MTNRSVGREGLRFRVLMALSPASGGYTVEQIEERWERAGMDAVRDLVRRGLVEYRGKSRYMRTPAGDAALPFHRALAEAAETAPPHAMAHRHRGRRYSATTVLAKIAEAAEEAPMFLSDLAVVMDLGDVSRRISCGQSAK